jgi:hypothetical protein
MKSSNSFPQKKITAHNLKTYYRIGIKNLYNSMVSFIFNFKLKVYLKFYYVQKE